MKNNKNNNSNAFFAFAAAAAFSFALAGAQAQDFNPGSNHSSAPGSSQTASTNATEAGPSTNHPATIAPTQNHGPTANPSTAATESAPSRCAYDLDGDGAVGFSDYVQLLSLMSTQAASASSGQSKVTFRDVIGLMSAWGDC